MSPLEIETGRHSLFTKNQKQSPVAAKMLSINTKRTNNLIQNALSQECFKEAKPKKNLHKAGSVKSRAEYINVQSGVAFTSNDDYSTGLELNLANARGGHRRNQLLTTTLTQTIPN